jgi:hypothetical protein
MTERTIVYCTSNREDPALEAKIITNLLWTVAGQHPIIAVSQRPMVFAEQNICVGDVGASYPNLYRQMLLGAESARTPYVMFAEADQLYPPGYFDVDPADSKLISNSSLWILRHWDRSRFLRKEYGEMTICVQREHVIEALCRRLAGRPLWGPGKIGEIFPKRKWDWFDAGPVVSLKTTGNLSVNTSTMKDVEPVAELPHWGRADDLSRWVWGSAENTEKEHRPLASTVTELAPLPDWSIDA